MHRAAGSAAASRRSSPCTGRRWASRRCRARRPSESLVWEQLPDAGAARASCVGDRRCIRRDGPAPLPTRWPPRSPGYRDSLCARYVVVADAQHRRAAAGGPGHRVGWTLPRLRRTWFARARPFRRRREFAPTAAAHRRAGSPIGAGRPRRRVCPAGLRRTAQWPLRQARAARLGVPMPRSRARRRWRCRGLSRRTSAAALGRRSRTGVVIRGGGASDYEYGLAKGWVAACAGCRRARRSLDRCSMPPRPPGANGQFAAEVMCLQTAGQFGDRVGSRLGCCELAGRWSKDRVHVSRPGSRPRWKPMMRPNWPRFPSISSRWAIWWPPLMQPHTRRGRTGGKDLRNRRPDVPGVRKRSLRSVAPVHPRLPRR